MIYEPVQDRYELLSIVGGRSAETGVNEDFEHRPTANGSCAVDLEQVLTNKDIIMLRSTVTKNSCC